MQNWWRWVGRSCVALILASGSFGAHAKDCVKSVRWYDDVPYTFQGPSGKPTGLTVDMLEAALGRMGCRVRWVELPWARALVALEVGKLDILPGSLKTEARQQFAYFSRPVSRSPNVLFMTQAAAKLHPHGTLTELLVDTDFRLGVQLGVAYGSEYDALRARPDIAARMTSITLRRNAWNMMALGRLDGMIADEITGLVELQQLGVLKLVKKTSLVMSSEPGYLAISKRTTTAEFVQLLDQSIGSMLGDGSFRKIWERYVPCPIAADQIGCR